MRSKDVRGLQCSDHLKEVLHRCLGARGKRYEAAKDLIAEKHQRTMQRLRIPLETMDDLFHPFDQQFETFLAQNRILSILLCVSQNGKQNRLEYFRK